jgi:hypothetical protein
MRRVSALCSLLDEEDQLSLSHFCEK